jgi:tetratricopeptide (TPR) repeat protein
MKNFEEGLKLFQGGDINGAIPMFEEEMQHNPSNEKTAFILGVCYYRNKEFERANSLFKKVISTDDSHYKAHYYLGLVSEKTNQMNAALSEFRIAVALKPDFIEGIEKLKSLGQYSKEGTPNKTVQQDSSDESTRTTPGELILTKNRRLRSYSFLFVFMIITFVIGIGLLILIYLLIRSRTTNYTIYQRRIDYSNGILYRKQHSLWLYEIQDTWITRTPFNLITNDATVHFRVETPGQRSPKFQRTEIGNHKFKITGIGNHQFMRKLWEEMRDSALVERRAMKRWWV